MSSSKLFLNPITFPNTGDASSFSDTSASLHLSGGMSITKKLYTGGKVYSNNGFDAGGYTITNVATPVNTNDVAIKGYVDAHLQALDFSMYYNGSNQLGISSAALDSSLTGGSGTTIAVNQTQSLTNLTVTGTASFSGIVLNGVGAPTLSDDAANKNYVDSLVILAGTGLTKTGVTLSVNAAQTQITSVGILSSLSVSGQNNFTLTTDSSSAVTGAVKIAGGLGVVKNIFTGSGVTAAGTVQGLNFTATTTSAQYTTNNSSGSFDFQATGLSSPEFNFYGSGGDTANSTINTGNINVSGYANLSGNSGQIQFSGSGVSNDLIDSINVNPIFNFQNSGGLTVNSTVNLGILYVNNTSQSSSTSTGAVIVTGGLAVQKNVFIGGNLNLTGSMGLSSLTLTSTVDSSSPTSGCLVVPGGMGVSKSVYFGASLNVTGNSTFTTAVFSDTTDSSSINSGSVILSGGLGISKNLFIGGNLTAAIGYIASLNVNSTVDSSSISTGSVILAGGIAVAKSIFIGTSLNVTGSSNLTGQVNCLNTTDSSSISTGSIVVSGGLGVNSSVYIGDTLNVTGSSNFTGIVNILNTTNATSISSGSLVISGGLGVNSDSYFGGSIYASGSFIALSTTDSNSVGTGSVIISGGFSVSKSVFIGSILNVTGNSTFIGTVNISNTTDSTNASNGSVVLSGGLAVSKNVNFGQSLTVTGTINVNSTIDSSSSVTGSFVTQGGLAIGKSITIGSSLNVTGTSNLTGIVSILNTTESSSTSTGSLVISGGAAITLTLFVGTQVSAPYFTSTVSTGTAPFIVTSTTNVANLNASSINGNTFANPGAIGSGTAATTIAASGVVTLSNTTASSSNSTGGVIISGGLAISNTTDAASLTSGGSITSSGGLAVAKTGYFGSNVYANNHVSNLESTATAGSTTTLTATSAAQQYFTGSLTQTVTLPVTSTLTLGFQFTIVNNSSAVITVQSSGIIQAMASGTILVVTCISVSDNTNAAWNVDYRGSNDSGIFTSLTSNGTNTFTSVIDSTSIGSGAVQISGGLSVAKNSYLGNIGSGVVLAGNSKYYSYNGSIGSAANGVIVLNFASGSFYGKVTAMLTVTGSPANNSVLEFTLHCQNGSTMNVYNTFLSSGSATLIWSSSLTETGTSISFQPATNAHNYTWNLSMHMTFGTLSTITQDGSTVQTFNF